MTEDSAPPATAGFGSIDSWSTGRKIGFRFVMAYFVLYLLPFPLDAATSTEFASWPDAPWHVIVPWVGAHLLRLPTPITIFEAGSGDTTYNYVQLLCIVLLALTATVAWSILDRRRSNYTRLYAWLRVYLRYYLCTTMILYGAVKVIKVQFPDTDLYDLTDPFGNMSPQALLWAFMGYSVPYNLFTGASEMLAGILVGIRRTSTLGALLAIAVLANVVMLNFSYDVPVKLYSLHLLAMAGFLVVPDARRLIDLLIRNRPTAPVPFVPLFASARLNSLSGILGGLFVVAMVWVWMGNAMHLRRTIGAGAPKPPLYGVYEVATFVRNGDTIPPLLTDGSRWRRMFVLYPGYVMIRSMSDSALGFRVEVDSVNGVVGLTPRNDSTTHFSLAFRRPDRAHLILSGRLGADSLSVDLIRRDEHDFRLRKDGFHWISEESFNY